MQPVIMPFGPGAVDVALEADLLLPRLEQIFQLRSLESETGSRRRRA